MTRSFPELTSFGTLLTFAHSLEETAADFANDAAENGECEAWRTDLENCARSHRKRSTQMERVRRERLNEVVLQPIYGMERTRYIPQTEIGSEYRDGEKVVDQVISIEDTVASFYEDAAAHAENVLSGVERTFRKLARESAILAKTLREKRWSGLS
jgi:hypothetical protein